MILLSFVLLAFSCSRNESAKRPDYVLVIHGGAGTILRENMTPELERQYREKMEEALQKGAEVLKNKGSSLDAVTLAVMTLEDSPLFNAGKGAVFTARGTMEMDAAIMDGSTHKAGAVAGVSHIRNPILAARAVMEHSPHVMMAGEGAESFAAEQGLKLEDSSYFFTNKRYDSYRKAKKEDEKHGTVGAVALDIDGNLAAATSTGGMTFKSQGRIGDSPIIGAGTFADNGSCAVSATGHGEFFMRYVVAYDISAKMRYKEMSLKEAAEQVILHELARAGGDGGVIAVDNRGNLAMPFNTPGMYRGYITSYGEMEVLIYGDSQGN